MPALKKTALRGRVTFIGRVADRGASLRSHALNAADLSFDGIAGETHAGLYRASCSRVTSQYPKGTKIRNVRQLSILSVEELKTIADKMGLETLAPEWVGASLVIEGIPDWSHIPPSSRLTFPSGASLTIDMQNCPCTLPSKEINLEHAGFGARFKSAASGLRGVTAWVECEGPIELGDEVVLHVPDQRAWRAHA